MKLFIDDIRNAPDDKWIVCRTITEAIRAIRYYRDEITEISLDHDISHQIGMGALSRPYPCEETYAAVCYFIGEVYKGIKMINPAALPKITLHTANKIGAENMEKILADYGLETTIAMRGIANRLEMEV